MFVLFVRFLFLTPWFRTVVIQAMYTTLKREDTRGRTHGGVSSGFKPEHLTQVSSRPFKGF